MREGKKDISTLFTYVSLDKYLIAKGRLGFIITQSVFKTTGASQGFRRFQIGDTSIAVIHVDDLSQIKPFEGAANRTAVMILQKGNHTQYPVPYTLWKKARKQQGLSDNDTLSEVMKKTSRVFLDAQPVDNDSTSSWITGKRQALKAAHRIMGSSLYKARMGSNTGGANGVYWLEVDKNLPDGMLFVSNVTEGIKRRIDDVQALIEPDLVFPLLRGRDIVKWHANHSLHLLVVQDRVRQREGIPENILKVKFPKTFAYLANFKEILEIRPDRKYYPDNSPFYTLRNVADYTYAPFKVVWPEVSNNLYAAVVQEIPFYNDEIKTIVPDHTVIFIGCDKFIEAHYICATLNSSPSQFVISSYIVLHPDPHILERINIPLFDQTNPVHIGLAELSQQAHAATADGDTTQVQAIESEIDRLSSQLWGLSDEELKEIQESLEELK